MSRIGSALREPRQQGLLVPLLRHVRQFSHQKQGCHGSQIADRVGEKANGHTDQGDEHARKRRPHHGGAVEDRRVECDRIHQVLLADHLDDERLPSGNVEEVDGAGGEGGDDHHPVLGVAARAEGEKRERWNRERRLGDEQDAALAEAVGHDAAELAAEQDRRELRGQHEADEQAAVRELQGEPRHRDALHPGADRRDDLAGEEEPVVAMAQGTQHPCLSGVTHPVG